MTFSFEKYGTFAGPGTPFEFRDNDDFDVSSYTDDSFNLTDVSMVLVNTAASPADYVYMHLDGSSTAEVTLERSTGPIPLFNVQATLTNFSNNVYIENNLIVNNNLACNGNITGPTITDLKSDISSKKGFDIPHPTKKDHRLRYICIEGPSAEVYLRGKLNNESVIKLPDYWRNLVDVETIAVTLTPIGHYQELFVEKIEWGTNIVIKNNSATAINCSFVVFAERKDTEKNISEYEGLTPNDYPGDNKEYNINGL